MRGDTYVHDVDVDEPNGGAEVTILSTVSQELSEMRFGGGISTISS